MKALATGSEADNPGTPKDDHRNVEYLFKSCGRIVKLEPRFLQLMLSLILCNHHEDIILDVFQFCFTYVGIESTDLARTLKIRHAT